MATLLGKAVCFNKQFCTNLVRLLIKPLKVTLDGVSRSESGEPSPIESTALFESLKSKLIFISEVLLPEIYNGQYVILVILGY